MVSTSAPSVLFFRTYQIATMPLYAAIIADLCASPELPFELATTLEDIGQEFMRFSERVNAELLRRGVLDQEADADQTIEAKIERTLQDLVAAAAAGGQARMPAQAILGDANVQQALRTALLLTHDLPRAPAP